MHVLKDTLPTTKENVSLRVLVVVLMDSVMEISVFATKDTQCLQQRKSVSLCVPEAVLMGSAQAPTRVFVFQGTRRLRAENVNQLAQAVAITEYVLHPTSVSAIKITNQLHKRSQPTNVYPTVRKDAEKTKDVLNQENVTVCQVIRRHFSLESASQYVLWIVAKENASLLKDVLARRAM